MVLTAAVTLVAQWPVLRANALCFDDPEYLVENQRVRQPSLAGAWRFLTEVIEPSTVHGYYQPLTMISLMLDSAAGGEPGNLMPFHRTSLILHALNTAMIALLLYEVFGHAWAATLVAVLFGLHPMTVETLAWVGERKTVLAAFFALPSILCYVRYARTGRTAWYVACALLFVPALMSKPTATPLPVCLLLLDVWPLNRISRKAVVEKIPLLVIAAISAWITYESQKRTAVTVLPGEENWWSIPLILSHNIVFYLRRIVWPTNPSSHYPMPSTISVGDPAFVIGLIGTAVLLAALIVSWFRTRAAAVGWLFFFVAIFPTMGVIGFTNVIAADKFAYLPSIGLMLPAAALLAGFWDRSRRPNASARRGLVLILAGAAAGGLVAGSRSYIAEWANTERLFRYMLGITPDAATVHLFLGKELADQGRDSEAMEEYRITLEKSPTFWIAHMNVGLLLAKRGEFDKAITHYRQALALKPDFYEAHNNLGNALMAIGDRPGAVQHYRKAIELRPRSADAHYNLANVLFAQGDPAGAIAEYELTLEYEPDHARARKNYGTVLLQTGRRVEAVGQYREALRLEPAWWDVANQLAWIQADASDPAVYDLADAVRCAQIACRITGRREPVPLATLAIMLARSRRTTEARQIAEEALAVARATGNQQVVNEIRQRLQEELAATRPD